MVYVAKSEDEGSTWQINLKQANIVHKQIENDFPFQGCETL